MTERDPGAPRTVLVTGGAGFLGINLIRALLARGDAAVGETVRLGGQVAIGSVSGPATDLAFVLTDGDASIPVHSTVAPTRSFREGSGAVVEGALGSDGVFEATQVIVKHDENYEAPAPGDVPSDQVIDPGEDP